MHLKHSYTVRAWITWVNQYHDGETEREEVLLVFHSVVGAIYGFLPIDFAMLGHRVVG